MIILPLADANATQGRAERIRSKLHELTVLHEGKSVGAVTVSVGVAVLPAHGESAKALLEAADAALYRAKREGRDRVVTAELPAVAEAELGGRPAVLGQHLGWPERSVGRPDAGGKIASGSGGR